MPRDFIVYTPASRGDFAGDFANPARLFDLVVNDWTGSGKFSAAAQPRLARICPRPAGQLPAIDDLCGDHGALFQP